MRSIGSLVWHKLPYLPKFSISGCFHLPSGTHKYIYFWYVFYCTLGTGVHVQNMQDCCIGAYMAIWFAASIPSSPISGISPRYPSLTSLSPAVPPLCPYNRPLCVMLPSLCLCVLIVQHALMSENMQCLVFCSCVSLLRMKVSTSIHNPAKDMNSSFLWLHSIPWCICATF